VQHPPNVFVRMSFTRISVSHQQNARSGQRTCRRFSSVNQMEKLLALLRGEHDAELLAHSSACPKKVKLS
ncbi:hypothetical protein, partial [Deinococcus multiflagellatus]|uniref:hypothetical protein n=1 Tax=Deinococcus multiflagellatus TaxID=1656887 RepID=UPI001CCD6C05